MTLLASPVGFATSSVWPLFRFTLSLNEFRGSLFHQLQAILQTSQVRHDFVSVASVVRQTCPHSTPKHCTFVHTSPEWFSRGKNKFWWQSFICGVSKIGTTVSGCVKYHLSTEIELEFLKVHPFYAYNFLELYCIKDKMH
jgi:hypothetical protein